MARTSLPIDARASVESVTEVSLDPVRLRVAGMAKSSKSDEQKRDAILRLMLATPHKPHVPSQKKSQQKQKKRIENYRPEP